MREGEGEGGGEGREGRGGRAWEEGHVEAVCPIDGCNLSMRPHLRGS